MPHYVTENELSPFYTTKKLWPSTNTNNFWIDFKDTNYKTKKNSMHEERLCLD